MTNMMQYYNFNNYINYFIVIVVSLMDITSDCLHKHNLVKNT